MHEIFGYILLVLELCMLLLMGFSGLIFRKHLEKNPTIVRNVRFIALIALLVILLIDFYFFNKPISLTY